MWKLVEIHKFSWFSSASDGHIRYVVIAVVTVDNDDVVSVLSTQSPTLQSFMK